MRVKYKSAQGVSDVLGVGQVELVQVHVAFRENRAVIVFDGAAPIELDVERDLPPLADLVLVAAANAGRNHAACAVPATVAEIAVERKDRVTLFARMWRWLKGSKP